MKVYYNESEAAMMTPQFPSTERLPMGMLLAATAGAIDAYTYLAHGGVFAGLQTGNMILMGVALGNGDWPQLVNHLIPFLVFAVGTVVVRGLQHTLESKDTRRKRALIVLGFEAGMALLIALIAPYLTDIAASSLVAIIAAAQLQEFRSLRGRAFTSIMMTGNLRVTATGLYDGIVHGSNAAYHQARDGAACILALIVGAGLSGLSTHYLGARGILFTVVPLTLAIIYLLRARPLFPAQDN